MKPMFARKTHRLRCGSRTLVLGRRTLVMGILNVTPDSFFDGGKYLDSQAAVARAIEMEASGADILDVGGESTRPGARPISEEEELARVLPVIEGLRGRLRIPISLDTQHATVAEAGIAAGAEILNDVSALRTDPGIGEVARHRRVPLILMHMRGKPATMQRGPFARDTVRDVVTGLQGALARARRMGIPRTQIAVDPGIGFGKRHAQNFELLAALRELACLDCPIVVGASRKAFIGWELAGHGQPLATEKRLFGTAATVAVAIFNGAHIVRVHDVEEMVQVVRIADAIVAAA
jgi:dihydropteroate synthase